jgi:hypothetical protein
MSKTMFAAVLAASLIMAPSPIVTSSVYAQTAQQAAPAKTDAKPTRKVSAGAAAMRERQKKCGAEWKAAKAAGTIEKGQTWPKYWSACNKRLKSAS